MKLKKATLSEICIIGDGAHASLKRQKCGIPYFTAKNITRAGIDYNCLDYISEETYNKYFKPSSTALTQPHKDDILYSIIGSIGGMYILKDERVGISSSVAIFRGKENIVLPKYLFYLLKSDLFKSQIQLIKGGVAQGFLSLSKLGAIEVVYHEDKNIQQKIVDILSTYDNLIENNQKQIKLLEEAAQRLYKEWFVDLRFPGHENTPIIDGVPEGWRKKKISEFGQIITGKTPSTAKEQYYDGPIPFVKIPDMHDGVYPITTEISLTVEGANSQKNKFIPKDSIMISCIATVGLVNIAVQPCQTNQQINSIVLNDIKDLYYVYFSAKRLRALLDGVGSNGATMTNVNKSKFSTIEVLYPTSNLRDKFYIFCKPVFDKIFNLSNNIIKLKSCRDCLLPKLMSGEIEIR